MVGRSRTEVINNILNEALRGGNKTRIMYRANLDFWRFERYSVELLEKGLVEVSDNPGDRFDEALYQTTQKRRELFETLKKAHEFISLKCYCSLSVLVYKGSKCDI